MDQLASSKAINRMLSDSRLRSEQFLWREYTEIHSEEAAKVGSEYNGQNLAPQTLYLPSFRRCRREIAFSSGEFGKAYPRGVLLRRTVQAIIPPA